MSLLNRKLKQIGRRFSVNGLDKNLINAINNNNQQQQQCRSNSFRNHVLNKNNDITNIDDDNDDDGDGGDDDQQQQQQQNSKKCLKMKKSLQIGTNNSELDYEQWLNAMRMIVRLPDGIPNSFRRKLWLTLADNGLKHRELNWQEIYEKCFNENNNPEDNELGIQIVKDLHRTGCSLFSTENKYNQTLLKQVLLAYARFNQSVGYCQGFNMLAAIILEIMEGNVHHSFKIMIYLIEKILPESYFINNLRGLSVDMVVFRDLMHIKLTELSIHLNRLQQDSYDSTLGIYYEPPLINAFTMQWFLTLFTNCLPKQIVVRIWDLIMIEGNEILLRTALVIWNSLSDRIMAVKTADEFYSIMNVLTRELIEFGPTNCNDIIIEICNIAPFPFPKLKEIRDNYYYNISPFNQSINQLKNGLINMFNQSKQILNIDDEQHQQQQQQNRSSLSNISNENDDSNNWLDEQILLLNLYLNQNYQNQSCKWRLSPNRSPIHSIADSGSNFLDALRKQLTQQQQQQQQQTNGNNFNKLDVSMLKKQYLKLKQRQRQVKIILKEGFQNIQSQSIDETNGDNEDGHSKNSNNNNSKRNNKFSMAKLLSGKKPIIHNNNNQNNRNDKSLLITRKRFNQCIYSGSNIIFKRSNTFTSLPVDNDNLVNQQHQQQMNSNIDTTYDLNQNKFMLNGKPTCNVIIQIQPSQQQYMQPSSPLMLQSPSSSSSSSTIRKSIIRNDRPSSIVSSIDDDNFPMNPAIIRNKQRPITPRLAKYSSGSSTSTELCDEILGIEQFDFNESNDNDNDDDVIISNISNDNNNDDNDNEQKLFMLLSSSATSSSSNDLTTTNQTSLLCMNRISRRPSSLSNLEDYFHYKQCNNDEQELFTGVTSSDHNYSDNGDDDDCNGSDRHGHNNDYNNNNNDTSIGSDRHFNFYLNEIDGDDANDNGLNIESDVAVAAVDQSTTTSLDNDSNENQLNETIKKFQEKIRQINIE